ncbi:ABC transporter permease [Streptomyces sp. AK02-01A]|uniref:ABC transporter permease n=1 Tax=Streptomyces sp. AK02-01A TaxID=3028648 RepID=UPI0029B1962E|nr:FtsX-like permease family protein [Streptomyces sp. AK02-01A]MDX3851653.1 ABC transporter permease [Streptomyces sp. AK02-01A]
MTLLDRRNTSATRPESSSSGIGAWPRDLALGIRFAVSGGREGWARTALTAVGVGLGVALLFFAASVPHMTAARAERGDARSIADASSEERTPAGGSTLLWTDADTEYHGDSVGGQLLRPEGPKAPKPPGVTALPGPGDMVVSPALRDLLGSPDGALLKERLDYRVVGTIADRGLLAPGELRFYAGSDTLSTDKGAQRTAGYGSDDSGRPMSPVLVVLIILICAVLLAPVAVFIATAVRFGGDRRDRRLAALRLVGADTRMTRRIAAGEALCGAVLGLLLGAGIFLATRPLAGGVQLWSLSAFPSDIAPVPALAALIVFAVPASAVLVTLAALRSVAIEPLGVVRDAGPRRRRLWWRLLMPVVGIAVLALTETVEGDSKGVDPYPVAAGTLLVLTGLTALLPWLVEAVVARLRGGPVPWQLAMRRLQLSSGTAARAMSGITVAVAGAIALQMMFGGIQEDFLRPTGQDTVRANLDISTEFGDGRLAERMIEDFRHTKGVTAVIGTVEAYAIRPGAVSGGEIQPTTTLTIGTCATLRELARLPSCRDGDTFVSHMAGSTEGNAWIDETARPGKPVDLNTRSVNDGSKPVLWTLPASTRTVRAVPDPMGTEHHGILATTGAVDTGLLPGGTTHASVRIDKRTPDAEEYVRNTAARLDPTLRVWKLQNMQRDKQYSTVQTGLLAGGAATLALIAASMLVSQIEQLRERKRLLSVLVAFGTRRSTLAWSVLWGTTVPVLAGTVLAIGGGLVLGDAMLNIVNKPVKDWSVFLPFAGAGVTVILLVTAGSLPFLWRMMRPDGLRTE